MYFSFSLFARQRERKVLKERENTLPRPTLSRALDKMDVASRACTLTLTIGATHVNILSASISKIQNLFSLQKLASKSHSKFARTFAARMLFI